MKDKLHWGETVAIVGLLIVFASMILPLLSVPMSVFRWIYSAGAVLVTLGKAVRPVQSDNVRVRRLNRIEVWGGVMFLVGAFMMFYNGGIGSDWIAFTLAGGAIEVYASLMIARSLKKG